MQILGDDFIRALPANNIIQIKGNGITFDVRFTLVAIEGKNNDHGYELNEDTWQTIVQQLGLEDGMIVVYTMKRSNKMWLTAFHIDGTPATIVNFRGEITLRTVQRALTYAETCNPIRFSRCQPYAHIHQSTYQSQRIWRDDESAMGTSAYMHEVEDLDAGKKQTCVTLFSTCVKSFSVLRMCALFGWIG
ncbi:hypothetical protein Tco_0721200 [Tanacetum coccineum]